MNGFDALTAWVQPQHLSTFGVDGYRADFESRTVRVLHITDFLKVDMATRLARFLGQEATYEQVYCLYPTHERNWVSADVWQAADEDKRWYTHGMLSAPDPRFRFSPNLFTFLNFRKTLTTSAFKAYVSAITGLPLGTFLGRAFHRMWPGDLLGPHSDHSEGRRLAFVFYLSPAWKADYGGALHIIGENDECSKIEATFNSLVVFDVTTQRSHYVADIRSTAGDQSRLTVGGFAVPNRMRRCNDFETLTAWIRPRYLVGLRDYKVIGRTLRVARCFGAKLKKKIPATPDPAETGFC